MRKGLAVTVVGSVCLAISWGAYVAGSPYRDIDIQSAIRRSLQGRPEKPTSSRVRPSSSPITITLQTVASGLVSPVALTHAGDGSGRLFIVDQAGYIRIVENGVLLPAPFLDVTAKLPALSGIFDERGLLGLAFHPDYATNGRFFIRYSAPRQGDPSEPCADPNGFIVGCHKEILAEYAVSANDPNVADPNSEILLISVDEPEFNHNSGTVAFGPDGYLYFTLGDGGGANDGLDSPNLPHGPIGNGQNINAFLGKMLRIDVDSPPQNPLPYAIPADNPFVGAPGLDEIYAYGFRNPFGFSWDDGPGGDNTLYLADVGQNLFEEVDVVVNGGNYGWVVREGAHCFDPFNPTTPPATCADAGMIDPISEYTHADGGLAVIGGFVYRGSQSPVLFGKYLYGDFSADFGPTGRLYYFDLQGPNAFQRVEFQINPPHNPLGQYLKGMGRDEDGEVYYLCTDALAPLGTSGVVYQVIGEPVGACCINGACTEVRGVDCDTDGGTYLGDGSTCVGDTDGDGADGACELCPNDPAKTDPGVCGCGVPDGADADGDSVPDCIDACPGVDDTIDEDGDNIADCVEAIPAVSTWGVLVLALGLLTAAKLRFRAASAPTA